ncbi:MAG: hypothetical protein IKR81_16065, partial [Victivallales bacterium]|nr:hypothetical protein [Victivallales bacterium]
TTVVTAGDQAFACGAFLLVASMRRNGMRHPVVVGAMEWTEAMKSRVSSLGDVMVKELPKDRRCLACQKPMLMALDEVKTEWVCWADSDAVFVGDCSEWLSDEDAERIVIRQYNPVPPDFTPANLEVWRRDIERFFGKALEKPRCETRVNTAFIVIHRKWVPFLKRWQRQIENVLPPDVEIIMKAGTPYFQTDESVLGSLLCFDPDAPLVIENYKANGSVDKTRYFAHFAYNPKPWQMWNSHSRRWHDEVSGLVAWMVEKHYVSEKELPLSLRSSWWPVYRGLAFAAPWVWRAIKVKRRIMKKLRG